MGRFPGGKRFAFTIFDDTDRSTRTNVEPVYGLLSELGLRTTKSVWPLASSPLGKIDGDSLEDRDYLDFVRQLQRQGFEIALHGCRNHDSTREEIALGLNRFHELLGSHPRLHCNHLHNRDNLYWGSSRLRSSTLRAVHHLLTRFRHWERFQGHCQGSKYYWADLCAMHIDYVRNFVFPITNLEQINPTMPYFDPTKPLVKGWYSSSDGGSIESFCRRISEQEQDRLEAQGGFCIMYTHFAFGFCRDGRLDLRFERLMRRLARLDGWFVPVSELLDCLRQDHPPRTIPPAEAGRMDRIWFYNKMRYGTS
jgi:hypothetical protein